MLSRHVGSGRYDARTERKDERIVQESDLLPVTSVVINRYYVDLTDETVRFETVQAEDLEDALGGIARATKLLATSTSMIRTPLPHRWS